MTVMPLAQLAVNPGTLSWVPLGPGKAFKPLLRFFRDNRGFVELLQLTPGSHIPLHCHSGEVHAFNLAGSRRLDTGELIGLAGTCTSRPATSMPGRWKVTTFRWCWSSSWAGWTTWRRTTRCSIAGTPHDCPRCMKAHCAQQGLQALQLWD